MECHFGLRIPKRHSHVFTAIIQFTVNIVFNYLASILNSLNSMIRISQIKQIFNQQTKRKKTNEKRNDMLKKQETSSKLNGTERTLCIFYGCSSEIETHYKWVMQTIRSKCKLSFERKYTFICLIIIKQWWLVMMMMAMMMLSVIIVVFCFTLNF